MAYISQYTKVTKEDAVIINKQTSDTLAAWALTLIHWKWPAELPNKEKPYRPKCFFGTISSRVRDTRGHQLIRFIEETLGERFVLRRADTWQGRTDEEFEDFCTMPAREFWKKWPIKRVRA